MTMAKATPSIQQEPYFAEGTEAMIALEAMVDHAGLRNVVWALAHICWAKAEHVQANWQDDQLARDWNANAAMLNRFARSLGAFEQSGEQSKRGSAMPRPLSPSRSPRTIAMAALSLRLPTTPIRSIAALHPAQSGGGDKGSEGQDVSKREGQIEAFDRWPAATICTD